jgi:5-methylcytosine-specific restriction endonuclease McrA
LAITVCQNCGSRRFKADRALAGRLICQSCGLAAGSRPSRPVVARRRNNTLIKWLAIVALVAVVIVLMA